MALDDVIGVEWRPSNWVPLDDVGGEERLLIGRPLDDVGALPAEWVPLDDVGGEGLLPEEAAGRAHEGFTTLPLLPEQPGRQT